jgi:hypothetical protein
MLKSIAIKFFQNKIILNMYLGNACYSKDSTPENPKVGNHQLRKIDTGMCEIYEPFLKLIPGQKLCAPCRKCLPIWLRERVEQTIENEYHVSDDENHDDSGYTDVQEISTSLQIIGESPIKTSKLATKRYAVTELKKITKRYRSKIKSVSPVLQQQMSESDSSLGSQIYAGINEFKEIISQLKDKFKNTDSRSKKLKILTALPKCWGMCTIERVPNMKLVSQKS